MPQVHMSGVRYVVRQAALTRAFQAYTGMGTIEARRIAGAVAAGGRMTVRVEDPDQAYNLASELASLGVNAEADESDY
ncbi:MAG: hypothetical protein ICV87_05800 [Gemmatimonadetes bacterium]|nr:hypothetical protein [Gemmatimonadota bacterium]